MATSNYGFNTPAIGGSEDAWGTQLNNNWTSLDAILSGDGEDINISGTTQDALTLTAIASAEFNGKIKEKIHTAGTSGGVTVSPSNGTVQTIAMAGDINIADGLQDGEFVTLRITSVGSNSVTWPSMEWMFGVAPNLDDTNTNWVQLWKVAGTLYRSYIGFSG
jgi:hypothetical protein